MHVIVVETESNGMKFFKCFTDKTVVLTDAFLQAKQYDSVDEMNAIADQIYAFYTDRGEMSTCQSYPVSTFKDINDNEILDRVYNSWYNYEEL